MICVAILATALIALLGNMYPLSMAHSQNRERSKAMEVVQAMTERLQGAQWHSLGGEEQPWSWHRRENPHPSEGNPPMTEDASVEESNLIKQGVISERTGLENLKLYLEYMRMEISEVLNNQDSWKANRDLSEYKWPESPKDLNLLEEREAVVFRILVTWEGRDGVEHRHEVVMARRR